MDDSMFDHLTLSDLQAMTASAAADLARVWMEHIPGSREHLATGWGLSVEVILEPRAARAIALNLIDQDRTRNTVARLVLSPPPSH